MNPEHARRSPAVKTGLVASLRGLLGGGGSGASSLRLLAALALAFATAALLTPPAQAHQTRLLLGSFGAASNPNFAANPYPLKDVTQVATDTASHDIYVADQSSHWVEKFDPSGNLLLIFGHDVNKTKVEEAGSTQAERNLCTLATGDVCQEGVTEKPYYELSPLESPQFIAVDNSSGPSHGDVYISSADRTFPPTAGVIEKFDPSGHPIETWATSGRLDGSVLTSPPAPAAGPFAPLRAIAVDPSGNLWVIDRNSNAFEFAQDVAFLRGFHDELFGLGGMESLAVDSEDNLYVILGLVNKFDATGKNFGVVTPSRLEIEEAASIFNAFHPRGLAVDSSTGDLYVVGDEGSGAAEVGAIKRFDSSCHPVRGISSPQPGCQPAETFGQGLISSGAGTLALDLGLPASPIYVGQTSNETSRVAVLGLATVPDVTTNKPVSPTQTSATLSGTVDPDGVELNPGTQGCRFEWGETAAYGNVAPCDKSAAQIGFGATPVQVTAPVSGLQAGHTYHYRLVASNPNDVNPAIEQPEFGADLGFGPPLIASTSALAVTSDSATLQAEVNPQSVDTHIRFEYVTQQHFEAQGFSEPLSTEALDAGSADSVKPFSFKLHGLAPTTTYRYRLLAESVLANGPETVLAPELTFTTQGPSPSVLPDSRQWQLVSPPDKHGGRLRGIGFALTQAAADGSALAYVSEGPTEAEPPAYTEAVQVLSTRGSSSWSTRDLSPPYTLGERSRTTEYELFSRDLSLAGVHPTGLLDPQISPEASEQTAFIEDLRPPCDPSCFHPFVTAKPPFANVPPGTVFGGEEDPVGTHGPGLVAATEDFSHAVIAAQAELVPGAGSGQVSGSGHLYQWSAGHLTPLSILPSGQPASGFIGVETGIAGNSVLSSDGSRVIFRVGGNENFALYQRLNVTAPQSASGACDEAGRACTLQLDGAEAGCASCESGFGLIQSASADGSRVFFTDIRRLTADSGANPAQGSTWADLYECRIEEDSQGHSSCALTDLTPETGGEPARVQGRTLGASADGSYVYFVANGVLTTAPNARGEHAEPGNCREGGEPSIENAERLALHCNLYLRHEGTTEFITRLAAAEFKDWLPNGQDGRRIFQPVRVSPNGRWLAFMSESRLTDYDNRDATTGSPVVEAYLYDAQSGALECPSCDPTGARPHGVDYQRLEPGLNTNGLSGAPGNLWDSHALVAAVLPGWPTGAHQPRYLSDSGRLFFNSLDALVPQDSNGTADVYQYEPPAVGGCTEASPTFSATSGGCVSLISSGSSREESAFLDASESGDDVFFLTASRLNPQDVDAALDVYDAHSCSATSPCLPTPPPPPPACQGDACQQPAIPPADPTPGSLTFQGAGNPLECPKGKVRKSDKCLKQKFKRKHHKKRHGRANPKRGGAK